MNSKERQIQVLLQSFVFPIFFIEPIFYSQFMLLKYIGKYVEYVDKDHGIISSAGTLP